MLAVWLCQTAGKGPAKVKKEWRKKIENGFENRAFRTYADCQGYCDPGSSYDYELSVMVLYNLADTFFVGMLNDPIQNAAVALAAPILLAFNAVNNLFGVGSSSMMSRAMGRKDFDTVRKSSAFGFYCAVGGGLLISLICGVFEVPILTLMGAEESTYEATAGYVLWTVIFGAAPSILNVVMAYMVRAEGNALHASIGTMSGCFLNIILDPIFILPGA